MATFLDIGLLTYFSSVFAALLVFAIVLAILQKTKVLGESVVINAIVAIALSLLVLISQDLIDVINFMSPWFVIVIIFLVLLLTIYKMFGVTEAELLTVIRTDKPIQWAIFAVGILIFVAAIFSVFGQKALEKAAEQGKVVDGEVTGSQFQENVFATIFHPKMLGLILIFAIAIFTVAFLGGEVSK